MTQKVLVWLSGLALGIGIGPALFDAWISSLNRLRRRKM